MPIETCHKQQENRILATISVCSWIRLSRDSVERVRMKSIRWISNQNSSSHISHHCGLFRKIQRNKWMDRKIEPHRRREHYNTLAKKVKVGSVGEVY